MVNHTKRATPFLRSPNPASEWFRFFGIQYLPSGQPDSTHHCYKLTAVKFDRTERNSDPTPRQAHIVMRERQGLEPFAPHTDGRSHLMQLIERIGDHVAHHHSTEPIARLVQIDAHQSSNTARPSHSTTRDTPTQTVTGKPMYRRTNGATLNRSTSQSADQSSCVSQIRTGATPLHRATSTACVSRSTMQH